MKVLGLDTETTGLKQADGHRIIEIAMTLVEVGDGFSMKVLEKYEQRINPLRAIDPGAEAVHKIRITDLTHEPEWIKVAPVVASWLGKADLVIAHNMAFDGVFIAAEMMRVGIVPPPVETYCTMTNARWATGQGKVPKLQEVCWALGIDYDHEKAHAANYDVLVMLKCFQRGLRRGFYKLPEVKVREAA